MSKNYPAKKRRKSDNVVVGDFKDNTNRKSRKSQDTTQQNQPQQPHCLKIKPEHLKKIEPLTATQRHFFESYDDGEEFLGLLGSAGTGKSFCAIYKAIEQVLEFGNPYRQVVIVRSEVQGRESGFMPGSKEEKAALFEAPYIGIMNSLFGRADAYLRLKEQKYLRFETTVALRGMTFDDSIIIVDEVQNCNLEELVTIITRVGENSKVILCGDIIQNDLNKRKNDVTGLPDFLRIVERMDEFYKITFNRDDIVRSALVKSFIIAMEESGVQP